MLQLPENQNVKRIGCVAIIFDFLGSAASGAQRLPGEPLAMYTDPQQRRAGEKGRSMPIYEYECSQCQEHFEQLVASSKVRTACPKCGSKKTKRLLSSFAAHSAGASRPCTSGSCPAPPAGAGQCASGKCPFS